MNREALHELIDRIPESEIVAAQRVLERLASDAAFRAAMSAPPDDEPVTAGDAEAIARARKDLQAGMAVSHDEIFREFGIRCSLSGLSRSVQSCAASTGRVQCEY